MDIFGAKKKPEVPPQVTTPVEEVLRMRQQGFTNNQVVQALQRNGYKTHQVFDAMNQADLRSAGPIPGAVPDEMAADSELPGPGIEEDYPNLPQEEQQYQEPLQPQQQYQEPSPEEQQYQEPLQPQQQYQEPARVPFQEEIPDIPAGRQEQPQNATQPSYEAQIEEVAEAIINEKWEDLMKTINKLLEWREGMENRMAVLGQGLEDIKANFYGLQKSVIGRVEQYDKTMKSVGTDMKAMDGVFKKILPALTENVNELSRLTKKNKRKPSSAKKTYS